MASVAPSEGPHPQTSGVGFGARASSFVSVDRSSSLAVLVRCKRSADTTSDEREFRPTNNLSGTSLIFSVEPDTPTAQSASRVPSTRTPQIVWTYRPGVAHHASARPAVTHQRFSLTAPTTITGVPRPRPAPRQRGLVANPRVGYVFPSAHAFVRIWAGAGVTYYWFQTQGGRTELYRPPPRTARRRPRPHLDPRAHHHDSVATFGINRRTHSRFSHHRQQQNHQSTPT